MDNLKVKEEVKKFFKTGNKQLPFLSEVILEEVLSFIKKEVPRDLQDVCFIDEFDDICIPDKNDFDNKIVEINEEYVIKTLNLIKVSFSEFMLLTENEISNNPKFKDDKDKQKCYIMYMFNGFFGQGIFWHGNETLSYILDTYCYYKSENKYRDFSSTVWHTFFRDLYVFLMGVIMDMIREVVGF